MATRRERLEAKLEKRQEWAGKAAARAESAHKATHRLMDGIPLGQPILVGHHSERHARKDAEGPMGTGYRGLDTRLLMRNPTACQAVCKREPSACTMTLGLCRRADVLVDAMPAINLIENAYPFSDDLEPDWTVGEYVHPEEMTDERAA